LGLTYENDGEPELAEREYRLAGKLPEASLALGNLSWQIRGDAKEAMGHYRDALSREPIAAAANNLAWLMLVEGGSLSEARSLALSAVSEGERRGEPARVVESYRSTLAQIEAAIAAGAKARREDAPHLRD
jgi:tetratricopeptide (TPR) repeat protein